MRNVILTTLLTLGFIILGFLSFSSLFQFLLPKIDNGYYSADSMQDQYRRILLFSLVSGCMPLFISITWKIGEIRLKGIKLKSLAIIVASIMLFVVAKRELIKFDLPNATKTSVQDPHTVVLTYPLDKADYTIYIFVGLLTGCVLSFFVFRRE